MTEKQKFWIADAEGRKACVATAADRDEWVRVKGWTETTEPVGQEFQYVRNANHGGVGVLNHEAALLHAGLDWFPSGPPGYDDPAPAGAKPKSAASGDKNKE